MARLIEIDTTRSKLMVPGPDVGPPIQNTRKINILWGVGPPIKSEKWFGNDLPSHPQGSRFAYTEIQAWRTSLEGSQEAGA